MASAALFSNNAVRGASKNLVEFKAGKMNMKGKMVFPDTRKGLLYVYQSEDSLMHFCWKDRTTGIIEDDLIIFPDDCEFKFVPQCKTGRVYLLRFKLSSKKFFFWLQDVKTEKDDENCRKINEVLNHPPTPGSQRTGTQNPEGDLQNLLNNMSQTQLMQLFGGVGQMGLGNLLGTMRERPHNSRASTTATSSSRPSTAQTPAPETDSDLPRSSIGGTPKNSPSVPPTNIAPLDNNTAHPIGDSNLFDLQKHLWNMAAPSGIDSADVQSGQAGPVVRQFGLGSDAINAAATGNLEEFVTALESETKVSSNVADQSNDDDKSKTGKTDSQDNSAAGKKNDEDDEMTLN